MYAVGGDETKLPTYVVYKALCMYDAWTQEGPKDAWYIGSKSGWVYGKCFLRLVWEGSTTLQEKEVM